MVAAMVLVVRQGAPVDESEGTALQGRTSRGHEMAMTVMDGKLHSFHTRAAAWCPEHGRWVEWPWFPQDGLPVEFEHEGSRFFVQEVKEFTDHEPPTSLSLTMRGRLTGGGEAAQGRLSVTAARGPVVCEGTARFRARKSS